PTPLQQDDLLVMAYPGSYRSDRIYPLSPAMQVKEWLEIIADSTTHHSRYYTDNELPPGILTAREATQGDIDNIEQELEAAKGDPRAAPVVGTDARWVEVGGSAVDLNIIEEQKWFLKLCAAAFGIPPTEIGMLGDANRNEGSNQLSIVHKRVTEPLSETIGQALSRQLLPQFPLYEQLDQPFEVALRFSDPRQERAQEEFVRGRWSDGLATYQEARSEIGAGDPDDETTVTINGTTIDYGAHPRPVVEALLIDARNDDPPGDPAE
ncbi:MAG: phage portal protein, partial [Salinivenus sp.]